MAIIDKKITDQYALYHGDCMEVLPSLPENSIHMAIYSPPFSDLFVYSSSERDLGNAKSFDEFMEHYEFVLKQINRVLMPGRMAVVHCMDLLRGNKLFDFTGEIIRLHERLGFIYHDRHVIWKEPLRVALRTRSRGLLHKQIVKDSTFCRGANPDYVVAFRKKGDNPIPVSHEYGLTGEYAGSKPIPYELIAKFKGWGNPKTNKLSHLIWQRYASSVWDDIRVSRVLPFRAAKDQDDEKHACPLQLDVIERALTLWSNPGEKILTPFMGVGSEVYGAVKNGRKGIGIELKPSYYRQALRNIESALNTVESDSMDLEFEDDPVIEGDGEESYEEAFDRTGGAGFDPDKGADPKMFAKNEEDDDEDEPGLDFAP